MAQPCSNTYNILSLDGGGAKGVYTLAFLRELEAEAQKPLHELFHAIYGTSTGAIIASLLGLGITAAEALSLYQQHVPSILSPWLPWSKSRALAKACDDMFQERTFEAFQTSVGIVATNWTAERPLIFKSSKLAAHSLQATFVPGFGCTISKAVQASCSASPFFSACIVDLGSGGKVEARDGGFAANNPTMFALVDALQPLHVAPSSIRLLTMGVGHYPVRKRPLWWRLLQRTPSAHLLQKTLSVSATTTEILVKLLCKDIQQIRVSDRFESPELATDFLECRPEKLNLLIQRGRDSYSAVQTQVRNLLNHHAET